MKRLALTLLGSLALGGYQASWAAAQTLPTTTSALDPNFDVTIDGKAVERGGVVYVKHDQCSDEVEFKFTVQNYLTLVNNLEVWVSATANCNESASRAKVNNNQPACWQIADPKGELTGVLGKATFKAKATDLFRNGADDENGCPQLTNSAYTVYFVPLDSPSSTNPSAPPAVNTVAQKLKGVFTLYTKRPTGPGGLKAESGESQVGVKWSAASGAITTTDYRAYFDTSVGDDSTCANSVLKRQAGAGTDAGEASDTDVDAAANTEAGVNDAGAESDAGTQDAGAENDAGTQEAGAANDAGTQEAGAANDAGTQEADAETETSSDDGAGVEPPKVNNKTIFASGFSKSLNADLSGLDGKGVAIGDYVAAAVVTRDIALNESYLSEVVCIKREETDSFLDNCERDPKCRGQFDSCSLHHGVSGRGAASAVLLLVGVGLAFSLRRRRV